MIPELTASAAAPRIAAIEHPFGLPFGLPDDAAGQSAVLRSTLAALAEISTPGAIVHLPFPWPRERELNTRPPHPPPIATYLRTHPWALPRFFNRTPPAPETT